MKLKVKLLFVFLILLFFEKTLVLASDEFETDYQVSYRVLPSGKIAVTQEISLTNRFSHLYARQYSLTLKGGEIENIQAYDDIGPLPTEIKQSPEATTINLVFNTQVVGTGKTLKFKLTYEALKLAQKNGRVWDITIPKLSPESAPEKYNLTLMVPESFGLAASINPKPLEVVNQDNLQFFRFSKEQLINSGVKASFGEFQVFDFTFTYYLGNPSSSKSLTEIALPPDTAYQRIIYQKIEPPPLNVRVDEDGNWLAQFLLLPHQKLNLNAWGKVKIFPEPQLPFSQPSAENLQVNLWAQKFWESESAPIRELAQELKTPQQIYNFVVKKLDYDFARLNESSQRMGALNALENPTQAICMEFTDLFIALSRAAGIPAREINGFAYTTNEKLRPIGTTDILHSWPEYFDYSTSRWIPIDPTWEKTTGGVDYFRNFDLNHFAFVIHGASSEKPYPVGSYREPGSEAKNITISFSDYQPNWESKLVVEFEIPQTLFWLLKRRGAIVLKNPGPLAFYNLNWEMNSENLVLKPIFPPSEFKIAILPPFSEKRFSLELKPQRLLASNWGRVVVLVNNQEFSQGVPINFPLMKIILIFLILAVVVGLAIFLTKSLRYVRKKR